MHKRSLLISYTKHFSRWFSLDRSISSRITPLDEVILGSLASFSCVLGGSSCNHSVWKTFSCGFSKSAAGSRCTVYFANRVGTRGTLRFEDQVAPRFELTVLMCRGRGYKKLDVVVGGT